MSATLYASESPPGKILAYLQRRGEATVKDLEELLGISTTAVREHLTHLQAKDLVTTKLARHGPGRPHAVYFLADAAHDLFPKEYDTLTTMLLREIASREGPDRLQALLDAVGARLAEEYRSQVAGAELPERMAALREALERRGIPVELLPDGDSFKLFACPYFDVAQEHAGVCSMERRMVEQVLGEHVVLEGTIREGQRSCHFTVVNKE
ncbi:MAG TPA: MarR family transcriptional regulator [Roseiflexaceae bacterium]|nr:MarR family transcriptional regulator [Roseiflexaceae bacterium]